MKKSSIAAMAALAAMVGMAATPQTVPANQRQGQGNQRHNEGIERPATTLRQSRATALNPGGGIPIFNNPGISPKEYGQYLQRSGRQKWVKSKRK